MDDVDLIHQDKEELKKMLNTTSELANRYHSKFGKEKKQSMTINAPPPPHQWKNPKHRNNKRRTSTGKKNNTYKYLGMTINNKGNMDDHIKKIKG